MGITRICVECNKVERLLANGRKRDDEVVGLCAACQDKARRELAPSRFPKGPVLETRFRDNWRRR